MTIEEIIEKFRESYKGCNRDIETANRSCGFDSVPGLIDQSQKVGRKFIFAMQPNTGHEPSQHSYTVVQYELTP